ncbi:MAG: cupin domain-containing protein [Candidatus Aminicenantes bacterium]|nr:cupin domain-containing protein [Candidatus Aminicenantes bacterium]
MRKLIGIIFIFLCLTGLWGQDMSTRDMLEFFVRDFKTDPAAMDRPVTFGIKIKDKGDWQVMVDGKGGVELKMGMPAAPSMYYITDYKTLLMIYRGQMSALTAMGRARMSEKTPMDFGFMEGFQPGPDFVGWGVKFTFHFWTRGTPEIIRFGEDTRSRFVHGALAKVLYYEKGLRSGWYQIKKGHHVNADPKDQKNPFPTLIIMIKGAARARIGGKLIELKKESCLHIPPGVTHEFWNDNEEPAECIIVMFGTGA